jgi:hypothetical protein
MSKSSIPNRIKKLLQVNGAQIIGDIIDKLVGTNISTTMKFDGLEIDVPKVKGSRWRGSGQCQMGN